MTFHPVTIGIALAAVLAAAPGAQAALDKPVRTKTGIVAGTAGTKPGVTAFKGIPFGAPPVGALRWKPPQPVAPWRGVRAADRFGHVCMQPPGKGRVNVSVDLPGSPTMSEDCLSLNVWTPAKTGRERLPVMVWIFGGAYYEGAGSSPHNHGDALAAKGVVLVNFNYRLGPLGFLAHPELTAESAHHASGNYALMDAISVLKWVKDNIAAFGGDPDNVTIFGESAGSAITAGLVGSPEAKGLFHRAIAESGGWMGLGIAKMRERQSAEAQTVEAAAKLGLKSLAELRAMPAQEASEKLPRQGMIVDGWTVPEDLSITFARGRQNAVDVIVGTNRDEGSFTSLFGPPMTAANWTAGAPQRWGSLAELGLAAYPARTDEEAKAVAAAPFSDAMAWHMRLFGESQAKLGKKAYLYYFTHVPPYAPDARNIGATHTVEIPYVFDNLAAPRVYPDQSSPELASADPREQAFAKEVSAYWVNFARTGDPNGPGLPEWPALTALGPTEAMVLDADRSGRGPWLTQPRIEFQTKIYERDVGAH
ncbi:MAG: carboxylesterase/lipase family protein [Sphingomonadales bacterium]